MSATIGSMPNKPATPVTTFRIPLALKARATAAAAQNDTTLTAVVIAALERYVRTSASKRVVEEDPAWMSPEARDIPSAIHKNKN